MTRTIWGDHHLLTRSALLDRIRGVLGGRAAEELASSEKAQVDRIRSGTTLREQLHFDQYLRDKKDDPTLTLGEHMKKIGRHF